MDIRKEKPKKPISNFIKLTMLAVLVSFAVFLKSFFGKVTIEGNEITVSEVRKGDLNIEVEGYGEIVSHENQLLNAKSESTVKKILLRPGAHVKKNTIILVLQNLKLQQSLMSEQRELSKIKSHKRQVEINNQREILEEEAELNLVLSELKSAKLNREAEEVLVKSGIVSKISFKKTKLQESKLKNQIKINRRRLKKLEEVHRELINIESEKINQQIEKIEIITKKINDLIVKAGMDGVLQKLSVELGQAVVQGQELAVVGSTKNMVAYIRVPQRQAHKISVGQEAIVDTRQNKVWGKVSRVDPTVIENTVNVEIEFTESLPKSVRPQMNIDGIIIINSLKMINYIERPKKSLPNSSSYHYRIDEGVASFTKLKFGRLAGDHIEIISGAKELDKIVISDLSHMNVKEFEVRNWIFI